MAWPEVPAPPTDTQENNPSKQTKTNQILLTQMEAHKYLI